MSLSDLLEKAIDPHGDDQGPWRQFVLDHLDWIAVRSKSYLPSDVLMYQYRYDLVRYLKEARSRKTDIAWIVLLLNDIPSDFDFEEPQSLIIPSDELIQSLRGLFATVSGNAK
jgi:hypothetical protein